MSPRGKDEMSVNLKSETEAEIEALAKKIRLNNTKVMAKIANTADDLQLTNPTATKKDKELVDIVGKFGWASVDKVAIPYIIRSDDRYVSLRMIKEKIFSAFNCFTTEVFDCFTLTKRHATQAEANLLNEINFKHCDSFFGKLKFTVQDEIISYTDFNELHQFLTFCYKVLLLLEKPKERCGFICINGSSLVPVVYSNQKKYVPLFYFEGESKFLEDRFIELSGWDMTYLRFCCKIQQIRKEFYKVTTSKVVDLEHVIKLFPPETTFAECWPDSVINAATLKQLCIAPKVPQPNENAATIPRQAGISTNLPNPQQHHTKTNLNNLRHYRSTTTKTNQTSTSQVSETFVPNPALRGTTPNTERNLNSLRNHPPITTMTNPTSTSQASQTFVPNPGPASYLFTADLLRNLKHLRKRRSPTTETNQTITSQVYPTFIPPHTQQQQPLQDFSPGPPTASRNQNYRGPPSPYNAYFRSDAQHIPQVPQNNNSNVILVEEIPSYMYHTFPYRVLRTMVEDKYITCISLHPHSDESYLTPVENIRTSFFGNRNLDIVVGALRMMGLNFYIPNKCQLQIIEREDRRNVNQNEVFVEFNRFVEVLPHVMYIVNSSS